MFITSQPNISRRLAMSISGTCVSIGKENFSKLFMHPSVERIKPSISVSLYCIFICAAIANVGYRRGLGFVKAPYSSALQVPYSQLYTPLHEVFSIMITAITREIKSVRMKVLFKCFIIYSNQLTTEDNKPKTNSNNREVILALISAELLMKSILFADGIMSHIVSSKNNVFKIRIYGKKEISYCVYRSGNFSHGKTLKEAIESLRYKASIRNTEEFKDWKLSDIKTTEELISAYRSITGACEFGVRNFCQSMSIGKKYAVREIVTLTSGSYGHEAFKNFGWSK